MIELTKKLPTEEGLYYHTNENGGKVDCFHVFKSIRRNGFFVYGYEFRPNCRVEDVGGYWAKVDQSMFEVVDDES